MKLLSKKLLVYSGILIGIIIFIWLVPPYWVNYVAIAHHNRCLKDARMDCSQIQIRCKAYLPGGYSPKVVPITDQEKIIWVLERLRVTQRLRGSRMYHDCSGHLEICFKSSDSEYVIRYDHGDGLYPPARPGDRPGFLQLETQACSELNSYLRAVGFTDDEMGLESG